MAKKRIGIFSFACCEGCQLQIIDLGKSLLSMLNNIDIITFRLAQEFIPKDYDLDIAIVEGALTKPKEIREIKEIRARSRFLITIGACAVTGGIPSLKNMISRKKVYGAEKYVSVDYHITGCPIEGEELKELLLSLLVDKTPTPINHPVCMECSANENTCLMLKGIPCLGPVTTAGCNALCPSINTPCEGCRGMHEDANIKAAVKLFSKMGMGKKEIENRMSRFSRTVLERRK